MIYVHRQVKSVEFGLFSPKDIKKVASVKIITPELYDKEGYPVDGGLMDVRMGVIDPGLRCKTCGGKIKECNGHFGYIDLARPVIHIKFIKKIQDILRSTCDECGRLLMEQDKINRQVSNLAKIKKEKGSDVMRKKIRSISNNLKNIKKGPHCSAKQIGIKL